MEGLLKDSMPAVMAPDISLALAAQVLNFEYRWPDSWTSFNSDLIHDSEGNDEDETEPTGLKINASTPKPTWTSGY